MVLLLNFFSKAGIFFYVSNNIKDLWCVKLWHNSCAVYSTDLNMSNNVIKLVKNSPIILATTYDTHYDKNLDHLQFLRK